VINLTSLAEVEKAIALCDAHLKKTGTEGTEVELFLTQFLLIHICGAYEAAIKDMIVKRAKKSGDVHLASYIENDFRPYRHLKITDLCGNVLNKFSDKHKKDFLSKIEGTEAETRYSNIIQARHSSAHGGAINLTFQELVESFKQAEQILVALSQTIEG
jgi:RiboL-PSP-HEPN